MRSGCVLFVLLLLCGGTSQFAAAGESKHGKPLPRRVLLVEPDIAVHEVSAGGVVEKVDDWSKEASSNARRALGEVVHTLHPFELIAAPDLSGEDKALLEQHAALYALVSASAYAADHSNYDAWNDQFKEIEYTLGPGMANIAEHAGADAAVFLVGTDHISSAGRKAAIVLNVVANAFLGVPIVRTPPAFMSAGVVDLRTGALLWFDTDTSGGSATLRDAADMKRLVNNLFEDYPGVEQH